MKSSRSHWDEIFTRTEESRLGWYEKNPSKTLSFLAMVPEWEHSTIFIPGAGTSILIDELLSRGAQLILNDISQEALDKVKLRLGSRGSQTVWIHQDIASPLQGVHPVDIWIDRAVLHFLTDDKDIEGYFSNVHTTVKSGGHALFAEFSISGAPKCAGLTLHRYSTEELSQRLGPEFVLVAQEDYTYINPSGDPRPYIYALYKRLANQAL
jgi:2-polyprenyl-3-methyl-5-hydroxy-6-metoxy-1,4-benzoquinol methylase